MRRLRRWARQAVGLFGAAQRDAELADEIESHLQLHTEENIRRGMLPDAARRAAVLKLGSVESVKEQYSFCASCAPARSVQKKAKHQHDRSPENRRYIVRLATEARSGPSVPRLCVPGVWHSASCEERRSGRVAFLPRTLPLRVLELELALPSDQAKIR